jgi:hypothetical protein
LKICLDGCSQRKGKGWREGPTPSGLGGGCGLSAVGADFFGFAGVGAGGGSVEDRGDPLVVCAGLKRRQG